MATKHKKYVIGVLDKVTGEEAFAYFGEDMANTATVTNEQEDASTFKSYGRAAKFLGFASNILDGYFGKGRSELFIRPINSTKGGIYYVFNKN